MGDRNGSGMSSEEDIEEHDSPDLLAGFARALRSFGRPLRTVARRKLPGGQIGMLANHGGNALDTVQLLKQRAQDQEGNRKSAVSKVLRTELSKGGLKSVMRHLALPLVCNTLLGTAMFEVYEEVCQKLQICDASLWRRAADGFVGGAAAGALYGGGLVLCTRAIALST